MSCSSSATCTPRARSSWILVGERLAPGGITLRVNGDKWGTSNDDYWRTLADADVIVTTTLQGPDRPFMDWIWVQQAVFRFIETMAAGRRAGRLGRPGITRFFAPGTDFLQFVSVDEAVAAIERLVRDPEVRRAVAIAPAKARGPYRRRRLLDHHRRRPGPQLLQRSPA